MIVMDNDQSLLVDKSVIVAAHPDDEALWFSSILSMVDTVVLCFGDVDSRPEWSIGRRKSIDAHPISNLSCLYIKESEVFEGADWNKPVVTDYGLEISRGKLPDTQYKNNYLELKDRLREKLVGYCNVFTHNPWGEYGHVEHVQVYRVIKALQDELHFSLWFTNYCSNKSFNLMLMTLFDLDPHYTSFNTDKSLGKQLAALYKKNNCWTWYDDYEWCDQESFILDKPFEQGSRQFGNVIPLNLIRIWLPPGRATRKVSRLHSLANKISNLPKRLLR